MTDLFGDSASPALALARKWRPRAFADLKGQEHVGQALSNALTQGRLHHAHLSHARPVGRYKVYIIDEVHMLSKPAFNSMLKTLEEPPAHVKFILATTDPQKIPVTVLSRCLQFNLKPMLPALVAQHLGEVLEQENVVSEPAALNLLARAAAGSMRDALALPDPALAHGGGRGECA